MWFGELHPFPKEDHLPDWEIRDYKVTKGERAYLFNLYVFEPSDRLILNMCNCTAGSFTRSCSHCVVSVKGLQSTLFSIIQPDKTKPKVHFLAVKFCTQAN